MFYWINFINIRLIYHEISLTRPTIHFFLFIQPVFLSICDTLCVAMLSLFLFFLRPYLISLRAAFHRRANTFAEPFHRSTNWIKQRLMWKIVAYTRHFRDNISPMAFIMWCAGRARWICVAYKIINRDLKLCTQYMPLTDYYALWLYGMESVSLEARLLAYNGGACHRSPLTVLTAFIPISAESFSLSLYLSPFRSRSLFRSLSRSLPLPLVISSMLSSPPAVDRAEFDRKNAPKNLAAKSRPQHSRKNSTKLCSTKHRICSA